MQLYKKAAVCLLAAAMAVSMMTACGGGDAPITAGTPLNPSEIVLPELTGGSGEAGGSGGDQGETGEEGQQKPKMIPIALTSSKLYAFNAKAKAATEFYSVENSELYDANGVPQKEELTMVLAGKDGDRYLKNLGTLNGKPADGEMLIIGAETRTIYYLMRADKVVAKAAEIENGSEMIGLGFQLPTAGMYATTVKVGSTSYYAETYWLDSDLATHTVCFTSDGMPKYEFTVKQDGSFVSCSYAYRFGAGSSRNLCNVPSGYKQYEMVDVNGQTILRGADGKEYDLNIKRDNGKVTEVTVKTEDGTDVTKDFPWLVKAFELGF